MTLTERLLRSIAQRWSWNSVGMVGALFVVAIVGMAAWDIVRGYRLTVDDTQRELQTQARVIAEQTARSVQAVDVVLRHIAEQHRDGRLDRLSPHDLHLYLREQTVGLVQIDGLLLVRADGTVWASSRLFPLPDPPPDVSAFASFGAARDDPTVQLAIDHVVRSIDGQWMFPIGRRLTRDDGRFAGAVAARGRVDYFQQFYRDIELAPGTGATLLHRDGSVLARHPQADGDDGERFAAVRAVPDYSLDVVVTRDAKTALAGWRAQATGTALRTLALALLAALLLELLRRQLQRLVSARASLEMTRERFALAVAGSDDGIWDWDKRTGLIFVSPRARELFGVPPGPDTLPMNDWYATLHFHPDDVPLRKRAIEDHMAGRTPSYEGEYRVRHPDGQYRWIRIRGLVVREPSGRALRMAGSVSDIDARKRTEHALRQADERYAFAMTGSNEGHWIWDVATDEVFASPSLYTLFGLPPDRPIATGAAFFEQVPVHAADAALFRAALAEHMAGRTAQLDVDYRIVAPDGKLRWLHTRGQCFRDDAGNARRVAGATIDISQRKHAEAALRESEERSALAIAGSNDGILYWDMVHDRMYSSERAMQICGVDSTRTLRTRAEWMALLTLHPEDVQRHADDLSQHLDGGTAVRDGEYRMRQRDGSWRWVRVRGVTVRDADGRPLRWGGSISDIDAQKRAESALRESEERYQLAVAGSNEGMWDWDMRRETFFLSARAQQLLGLEPGEPMRPCSDWWTVFRYHPDDEQRVRQGMDAYLGGAGTYWEVEYRLQHASGDWRWYRERGVALRDADAKPYRMAGSLEDISERKRAETERVRLEGQLRQSQKLEAMGTLAGGIAHDFNNILAAILGYGEMAQKEAREGTPQRRHLDAALSAGLRAKSLVERILAFSRSGMGERVPVHVQSVVAEALDAVAASLPRGVTIARRLDGGNAAVLGDATQIHQVVMNLCANAVQSMKASGTLNVAVEALQLEQRIAVATCELQPGAYVRLIVEDSGAGIAPQLLERIFDPFFTTKQVGVGTGLGLSLVHGIVADLGGGIGVTSRVGVGSTFTVYLPWGSCVAVPATAGADAPPAVGGGETVLLVDDEEPLVRLGEETLAELGYEPVGFSSSAAALRAFRDDPSRFDAVLSDEAMPEITGSELAREIRKLRPDIPIVLMTGYATPAMTARARAAGVVEVLSKPLVARDIARSLRNALRSSSAATLDTLDA
jgi:PAS domain S-box-containing protein